MGHSDRTRAFVTNFPIYNMATALDYWEQNQDLTIFSLALSKRFAVVHDDQIANFTAAYWKQISPEELEVLLKS